jgi:hypothetical protein
MADLGITETFGSWPKEIVTGGRFQLEGPADLALESPSLSIRIRTLSRKFPDSSDAKSVSCLNFIRHPPSFANFLFFLN